MPKKPRPKPSRSSPGPARIEMLRVENYRALRSIELRDITPLTVLLGANGSGKSTVFDVFNFLSECFALGVRTAWDKRGRFRELRSRGSSGPIVIELRYRESPDAQPATYHLEIDEQHGAPVVVEEWLRWRRVARDVAGAPYKILSFKDGRGWVISGDQPRHRRRRSSRCDERRARSCRRRGAERAPNAPRGAARGARGSPRRPSRRRARRRGSRR